MTRNIGNTDRILRAVIAIALGMLIGIGVVSGGPAIILGIIAIVLLVTSIIGSCPLYMLLHIRTWHQPKSV